MRNEERNLELSDDYTLTSSDLVGVEGARALLLHRDRRPALVNRARALGGRARGRSRRASVLLVRRVKRAGAVGAVLERLARGDRDEDERDEEEEEGNPAGAKVRQDRVLLAVWSNSKVQSSIRRSEPSMRNPQRRSSPLARTNASMRLCGTGAVMTPERVAV